MQWIAKLNWVLVQQFGLDLRKLIRAPLGAWRYVHNAMAYRRQNHLRMRYLPCLHDWWEQAGAARNEYFWQDLFVARLIFNAAPRRHIDVGSRLDGFVAHVASFRDLEVLDVRPLTTAIPGVTFRQADMMNPKGLELGLTDSLSCLHALEHFGLGRYGDPLDAAGFERGMAGLVQLLEPSGTLYLSCPVGKDEVFFNAHRAMRPSTVMQMARSFGVEPTACWLYDSSTSQLDEIASPLLECTPRPEHSLAIFTFMRHANS